MMRILSGLVDLLSAVGNVLLWFNPPSRRGILPYSESAAPPYAISQLSRRRRRTNSKTFG